MTKTKMMMTTKTITMMMTTNRSRIASVMLATACALLLASLSLAPTSLAAASTLGDKKLDPHQPYALSFGTVFGPDQRPVRGVKLKIRRQGEKKALELVSDGNGEFAHRYPAGKADYVVWADLKDKQAAEKTQVKVHIDNDERQDITLHLVK